MKKFEKDFYKKISFDNDIFKSKNILSNEICDQNILVIGGAGTIGSNYIKQILKFKPSKITVVDINENGLTELTRDLRSSDFLDYKPEYITYPVNLLSKPLIRFLILTLGKLLLIFLLTSMSDLRRIKFL